MSYGNPYLRNFVPVVVSERYVSLKPFALNTVKKWSHSWTGDFNIEDENKNCVYRVHRSSFFKKTIVLQNAGGQTVIYLRSKTPGKWKAYNGSATRDDNLLFTSHRHGSSTSVYFPAHSNHHLPDFIVKTNSWRTTNFKVFYKNQVIAETTTEKFKLIGKKKMIISGITNIDQAFIAAILVIMEEQMGEDVQAATVDGMAAAGAITSAAAG